MVHPLMMLLQKRMISFMYSICLLTYKEKGEGKKLPIPLSLVITIKVYG